jgi:SAM-dependent methyltransferase
VIAHHIRYLWYLVVGASAIRGLRLGQTWWDDDYRRDGLARTEGDTELPRHLLVAGLARHYAPGGSILDVGCGTGALTTPLRASFAGTSFRYLGLDYSAIALQQAAARRDEADVPPDETSAVEFVQADFDEYRACDTFDVIIFSESLYYAPDPVRTVRRYVEALRGGGIIIVSMWHRPNRHRVWRALCGELREQSRSRLVVPRRPAWDVVVYTPTGCSA